MLGILISVVTSLLVLIVTVVKSVLELVIHLLVLFNPFGLIFNLLSFVISCLGWILITLINILYQIVSFVVARIVPGLLELITYILQSLYLGIVYLTQFINSTIHALIQLISKYTSTQDTKQFITQPTLQSPQQPIYKSTYQPINQCQRVQMLLRNIQLKNNNNVEPISIDFNANENNESISMVSIVSEFIQQYGHLLFFAFFVFVVLMMYRRGRIIQRRNRYQIRKKQSINQVLVFSKFIQKIKQKIFKFIEKFRVRKDIKIYNTTALQTIMNSLVCPITCCPLIEPACLKCGHTFEKQPLRKYLRNDASCPLCRKPCSVLEIYDNYVLKEIIDTLK